MQLKIIKSKVRKNKVLKHLANSSATKLLNKRNPRPGAARWICPSEPLAINKIIVWDQSKPVKYIKIIGDEVTSTTSTALLIKRIGKVEIISTSFYGGAVFIKSLGEINKYKVPSLFSYTTRLTKTTLPLVYENKIINLYSNLFLAHTRLMCTPKQTLPGNAPILQNKNQFSTEKLGYLKHLIRLRYRWFFKPKLAKFKLFKKFFKRSLKRFRKINKNKLFVEKFRNHFSRLTGFKEKSLFKLWLPFRRNYNHYWSTTNAVLRFSQSLILTPPSFLVFLRISPSLSASKYLVKSGGVSINGLSVTNFTTFKPGDMMQLNISIWKSTRSFFSYQRWSHDFKNLQQVPFIYVDWSSMIFFILRWPHKHELVAPSFLSERWVRYYIRLFPVKTGKFKRARNNLKVYKKTINKK